MATRWSRTIPTRPAWAGARWRGATSISPTPRRSIVGQAWRGRPGVDPTARFAPPSFEEVITTFPAVRLNVDIKQWSPPMVEAAPGAVAPAARPSSASPWPASSARTLLAVRRRGYGGETALAQTEVAALLALPRRAIRALPFVGTAAQVPLKAGPIRFDRVGFIDRCHDLGLRVDFWTVDDPAEARRLIALGADGVMTDDPARMVAGLGRGARA
jgi:glycerophosphoryl diester phosphodiesterase